MYALFQTASTCQNGNGTNPYLLTSSQLKQMVQALAEHGDKDAIKRANEALAEALVVIERKK